jgi:hypothetical protein
MASCNVLARYFLRYVEQERSPPCYVGEIYQILAQYSRRFCEPHGYSEPTVKKIEVGRDTVGSRSRKLRERVRRGLAYSNF